MSDNNETILMSLGEIKGCIGNQTKVLEDLNKKQDEQSVRLGALVTNFEVFKTHSVVCKNEFDQINSKLGRDYITLNELKNKSIVDNGIDLYKGKKRVWWQWALGIFGAVIGILIGLNQLVGLTEKFTKVKVQSVSAVYSAPLVNPYLSKVDTTAKLQTKFKIDTNLLNNGR